MNVKRVIHGMLNFETPEYSPLSIALDKCDIDHNGIVDRNDFADLLKGTSVEKYADAPFRDCVTEAFYNAGEIAPRQRKAFRMFLDVFSDVERAGFLASEWVSNRTLSDTSGEKNNINNSKLLSHFKAGDVFANVGGELAANVANVYLNLINSEPIKPGDLGDSCGHNIREMSYNPERVPSVMRSGFEMMIGMYEALEAVFDIGVIHKYYFGLDMTRTSEDMNGELIKTGSCHM